MVGLSFCYRTATDDDLEAICTFPQTQEELFYFYPKATFPLTKNQLLQSISHRSHSTVVEKNGVLAGFANFYEWQQDSYCKVGNFIVNPALRRQGVARFLLDTMIFQAKESYNANQVQVACFNENTEALLFYHKFGFVPFKLEQRQTFRGQETVLLHLCYELI